MKPHMVAERVLAGEGGRCCTDKAETQPSRGMCVPSRATFLVGMQLGMTWVVRALQACFAACRWCWAPAAGHLLLLASLVVSVPAHATDVWQDYGSVRMLISSDQTRLSAAYFHEGEDPSYWESCSAPIRQKVKVKSVKFRWRKEIESFTVHDPKWGDATYEIDLAPIPEVHKWLFSTLVRTGNQIAITSRGCGSGAAPYLTAIERSARADSARRSNSIGTRRQTENY